MDWKNLRKVGLITIDVVCYIVSCLFFIFLLNSGAPFFLTVFERVLHSAVLIGCVFLSRVLLQTYVNIWRYAHANEYFRLIAADLLGGILYLLFRALYPSKIEFIRAVAIITVACLASLAARFLYQILRAYLHMRETETAGAENINIAIVGAGRLGTSLVNDLMNSRGIVYNATENKRRRYNPVCFFDNDFQKIGSLIDGIKVLSEGRDTVMNAVEQYSIQEFVIALPDLSPAEKQQVYEKYAETGKKVKIYDYPLSEEGQMEYSVHSNETRTLREFKIEELLFRDSKSILSDETRTYYAGKVVMVTGGGGSIGSELCRQIVKCNPQKLIIVDIYENNAYDIQQELLRNSTLIRTGGMELCVEIASVRDREKIDELFALYRPQVVFHAAAHKHVPLMEQSCSEAVKNNVFGTYNVANAAEKYGVQKFIMISTDKAVNPTNVMGATKRMCEMIIQCRKGSNTSFAAVRFGNVLGSNGSVIPLFKKQIEAGGPVTITDKRIIRYFMIIPEASQLVMTAGAMAKSGELFVLDMGNPVKILDLAENMIRLSGFRPYKDIDIVEIGLRPGEKLYEELLIKTEEMEKTENKMIFIERDTPLSREAVEEKLDVLRNALLSVRKSGNKEEIRQALMQVVPTFHDASEVNRKGIKQLDIQIQKV